MYILSSRFKTTIDFAKKKFNNIRDGAGGLIFEHNLRVAYCLEYYLRETNVPITIKEKDLITAASIHDIVEDTDVTLAEIQELFGENVAKWVGEMTITFERLTIQQAVKPLYNYSDEAILIKMFDVYDNVKKSPYFIEKNDSKWLQTFWLPLLSEYKKIFSYKITKIKSYPLTAKSIYQDVIKEIKTFTSFYKFGLKFDIWNL